MEHFQFDSPQEKEIAHIRGLAVNREGQCFEFTSEGGWVETNGPNTAGSGERIAQHYLLKGCDALTAVYETCKTELSCGGNILGYDYVTGKFIEYGPVEALGGVVGAQNRPKGSQGSAKAPRP